MINVIVNHTAKVIYIIEEDLQDGFDKLEGEQSPKDDVDLFGKRSLAELLHILKAYPDYKALTYQVKHARYRCTITLEADTESAIIHGLLSAATIARNNSAITEGEIAEYGCLTKVVKNQWGEPLLELQVA